MTKLTEEQQKLVEAILYEICACCVHKPLEIHEGLFRGSPTTHTGTGCWQKLEGKHYCSMALKSARQILLLINARVEEAEQRGINTALTAYESTCQALIEEAVKKERERHAIEFVCPNCGYRTTVSGL